MSRNLGSAYQYLHRSKIRTDKFQSSLFRLKLPKLAESCSRYLAALEPIFANDPRINETKAITEQFRQGQGADLQSKLEAYNKVVKHTSYINQFWFDMYLSSRVPLPLNFNPFLAWKDAPTSQLNDQVVRGTNFLISAARFKRSLEENVLVPDLFDLTNKNSKTDLYKNFLSWTPNAIATPVSYAFKVFPLDMSQYKNLFNSTRIPKKAKDEILKSDPRTNRHVLVLRGGKFYTFDLLDNNGDLLSPEKIYASLQNIVSRKKSDHNFLSISELTAMDRDSWAEEREHLVSLSDRNKKHLSIIDSSLFAICLDEVTYEPNQTIEGAHNFLHGSNHEGPLNRWFDKSFSIIITKDGHSCINFEHSWGDGVSILRFFNETFNDQKWVDGPITNSSLPEVSVSELDFDLDDRLKSSINKARTNHLKITSNLEIGAVQYSKLNRDYFKKNKLSPDSMAQLSFQMAYKKLHNSTPVTYESCSTAAFRGGRTETVRPCTNETNAAAKAIIENRNNAKHSNTELKELLKKCSTKHFQLCKEASMGQGFDRHLFALKEMALRSELDLPKLYKDPIFAESSHYTLSTSTLYGDCFAGGGFAPVVPDGFGLGYGHVDSEFGVLITSYKDRRNNTQFSQALTESLDDLTKILEK